MDVEGWHSLGGSRNPSLIVHLPSQNIGKDCHHNLQKFNIQGLLIVVVSWSFTSLHELSGFQKANYQYLEKFNGSLFPATVSNNVPEYWVFSCCHDTCFESVNFILWCSSTILHLRPEEECFVVWSAKVVTVNFLLLVVDNWCFGHLYAESNINLKEYRNIDLCRKCLPLTVVVIWYSYRWNNKPVLFIRLNWFILKKM